MDQDLESNYTIKKNAIVRVQMEETNNEDNPNKCYHCGYSSSRADHLKRHLRMHDGEKSKKCSQCDSAFSQASDLRRHLKTHSGEKSNKCNQCDYASAEADNLRRHLKTHNEN